MKIPLIFTLILSLNWSCGNHKPASRQEALQKRMPEVVQKNGTQKTGNQSIEKYGFRFQIPDNWQLQTNDIETKNLKGEVKTIETSYVDNTSGSHIRLVYHPGDSGMILYRYYSKDSKSKTVKIAGEDSVAIDETLTTDGKGHLLPEPVTRHKIYIPEGGQKGVLEIVYDLPANDANAARIYENFIKGIKPVE